MAVLVILCFPLFAVGMFVLFGPWRERVLKRPFLMDPVYLVGGRCAVVLVHGTFARLAPWTTKEHEFVTSLKARMPECDILRLLWSGDNYHSGRIRAGMQLACWIKSQPRYERILLVGHSHGGSIATYAATASPDRNVKVATLSTPFISPLPRHATLLRIGASRDNAKEEHRLLIGMSLYAVVGIFAACSQLPSPVLEKTINDLGWISLVGLLAAPFLTLALSWRLAQGMTTHLKEWAKAVVRSSAVEVRTDALLIIRTTADEASGAMAVGQFLSWVLLTLLRTLALIGRALFRLEDWAANASSIKRTSLILACYALFAFGIMGLVSMEQGSAATKLLAPIVFSLGAVLLLAAANLLSCLISPVMTIASLPATALSNLPFGMDLAILSTVLSVSVETTPQGTCGVTLLPSGDVLLAHSTLYESETLPPLIESFFRNERGWLSFRQQGQCQVTSFDWTMPAR